MDVGMSILLLLPVLANVFCGAAETSGSSTTEWESWEVPVVEEPLDPEISAHQGDMLETPLWIAKRLLEQPALGEDVEDENESWELFGPREFQNYVEDDDDIDWDGELDSKSESSADPPNDSTLTTSNFWDLFEEPETTLASIENDDEMAEELKKWGDGSEFMRVAPELLAEVDDSPVKMVSVDSLAFQGEDEPLTDLTELQRELPSEHSMELTGDLEDDNHWIWSEKNEPDYKDLMIADESVAKTKAAAVNELVGISKGNDLNTFESLAMVVAVSAAVAGVLAVLVYTGRKRTRLVEPLLSQDV